MTKKELLINHAINVVFFFVYTPTLHRPIVFMIAKKKKAPAKNGLQCTKKSSSKTFHAENSANLGLGRDKFKGGKAPY